MGLIKNILGLFKKEDDYYKNPEGYDSYRGKPSAPEKKSFLSKLREKFSPPTDIYHTRLHMSPVTANFLVKEVKSGKMYFEKAIKREGKSDRIISIPDSFLKNVQRRILSRILNNIEINNSAHGFIKHRSIFTALEEHTSKRVVVVIDIRNFFDTISGKRVFGIFKANGFDIKESAVLANLCCYKDKLPQGAPTSPMIANIVCKRLDSRLLGLTLSKGYAYTRYADDLIFSGNERIIRLIPLFKQIINEEGFETAEEKFRIMRSGSRQRVLGLNVNTKVSVPKKVRRIIRAMIHQQLNEENPDESMLDFLYGHVGLMAASHPSQARKLKRKLNKIRKRI